MPRNRIIKVDFWDDEKLATSCSRDARLLYVGMWNFSDDYGSCRGNVSWLKSHIFPYEVIDDHDFVGWLHELESATRIVPYKADGESYYYLPTFLKHQTIDKPSARRNPVPPGMDSDNARRGLGEDSTPKGKGKGKEKEKGKGERDSTTTPRVGGHREEKNNGRKTAEDKRSLIWTECIRLAKGDEKEAEEFLRGFSRFKNHTGARSVNSLRGKWLDVTFDKAFAESEERSRIRRAIREARNVK